MTDKLLEILARINAAPLAELASISETAVRTLPAHKDAILRAARLRKDATHPDAAKRAQAVQRIRRGAHAEVGELLRPFAAVANAVPGNSRSSLTSHGGLKRGPDKQRIAVERYSAIKAGGLNASVLCIVLRDGDTAGEPRFYLLHQDKASIRENSIAAIEGRAEVACGVEGLDALLARWKVIAEKASERRTA